MVYLGKVFLCLFLISCKTTPSLSNQQQEGDFLSIQEILEQPTPVILSLGTEFKGEFTRNSTHLFLSGTPSYRTVVKLFKIESLEQGVDYKISVRGFGGANYILIPAVAVYNKDFIRMPINQIGARTLPPGMIDPISYLLEFRFTPERTDDYFLVFSADMTMQHGITIIFNNQYGQRIGTKELVRNPYLKFRISVE